jgi:hypothetical protein
MRRILLFLLLMILPADAIELQYVWGLQPTENMALVEDLRSILENGSYNRAYEPGIFDYFDSCAIAKEVLAGHGHASMALMRAALKNSSEDSHLWLAVPDGSGQFAFIETTLFAFSPAFGLGGVVIPEDVRVMGYDRGYVIEDLGELARCFGRQSGRKG